MPIGMRVSEDDRADDDVGGPVGGTCAAAGMGLLAGRFSGLTLAAFMGGNGGASASILGAVMGFALFMLFMGSTLAPVMGDDEGGDDGFLGSTLAAFMGDDEGGALAAAGRFNILLEGTTRFRIETEDPPDSERLYRVAHVRTLDDGEHEGDSPQVQTLRGEVRDLMRQLLSIVAPNRVELFEQQPILQLDDEAFVNTMSQSLDFVSSEKQALLEANSVRERYERLTTFMRFRLAELSSGSASGSGTVQ